LFPKQVTALRQTAQDAASGSGHDGAAGFRETPPAGSKGNLAAGFSYGVDTNDLLRKEKALAAAAALLIAAKKIQTF